MRILRYHRAVYHRSGMRGRFLFAVLDMRRSLAITGIVVAALLGVSALDTGCALGPRYANTRDERSSEISVRVAGNTEIYIERIDGLVTPLGMRYPFSNGTYTLYIKPGRHKISLGLISRWTWTEGPETKEDSAGGHADVDFDFKTNGRYHVTANFSAPTFNLVLWDDTEGHSSKAGEWSF